MSSFLSRVLRPTPEAQPAPAAPARRPLPPTGQLRRERRTLVRRDEFREDLIYEQVADLIGLEDRLHELELLLSAATGVHRSAPSARCACGAPVLWGQHFCANCGRPAGDALVACTSCGHALPADAKFCASCGTVAAHDA